VAKKNSKKIATKGGDQYMLRLPAGLRDRVARRAAENGRSMNIEIIDAIEKYLDETDRISQLWEMFEKHRENIEAIPRVLAAVENIEVYLERSGHGESPAGLRTWRMQKEHEAREAARPLIAPDQVQTIKALLKEIGVGETKFLAVMKAPRIEEIRNFERAISVIEGARRPPEDQPA
jgi:predicted DNA-binding protein